MNHVFRNLALILLFLAGCTITGNTTAIPYEESFSYSVLFCEQEYCLSELARAFSESEEVICALYNSDKDLLAILEKRGEEDVAEVIINHDAKVESSVLFRRKSRGLMHNKFCVFDKKTVWTGSFNPVKTGKKVYDDVLIINSSVLASNYLREFEELKTNESFPTPNTKIMMNDTLVENHFCPEDGCIDVLQGKLKDARKSILFASYSFTHPKIANELIVKSAEGVEISGIIEKGTKYSQYQTLKSAGLNVIEHEDRSIIHHKFFVIDGRMVMTGSFNPSRNGDERNDENVLIIHNEEVARLYASRFETLLNKTL